MFCPALASPGQLQDASPARVTIPPILLIEPREATPLDAQIRASQERIKRAAPSGAELERLAWLFVAKARTSSDPGFNTLAAVAADSLEQAFKLNNEAWLIRGHVLHTRHRFAEAEQLGRRLVTSRGAPGDYALLGDALYDQGRIDEAANAYQHMVDLKPSLDSYSRAANIRWIRGDVAGAVELQSLAVRSGGPGDPGSLAWSLVRLGHLVWQQENAAEAGALAARALELVPDFQPALLLQGRLLLAAGDVNGALAPLAAAVAILPLPEGRWVYADALRAAGREAEAAEQETRLVREGPAEDPRTVALFLATHGRDPATAARLASAELEQRTDIMTHSVVAVALAQAGRIEEALTHQRASRLEGAVDARLLLAVGRVAALARQPDAARLLEQAGRLSAQLLPSERRLLEDSLALLSPASGPMRNAHATNQKSS